MTNKRHKPDQIVTKLRQVEVRRGQGMAMADAVRQVGVSELTFHRWRKRYGAMSRDQLRQLKRLQKENERLSNAVDAGQADLEGSVFGKLLSPSRRRACIDHGRSVLLVSERRV